MEVKIHESWQKVLNEEFQKVYFKTLTNFVRNEYINNVIYPPAKQILRAFDLCPFNQVKVVILGQDPYHGAGQANGLSFSVNHGNAYPPSLHNILKELHSDIGNTILTSGDLQPWAKQGVLLINATLTVREGNAGSHQGKGWEQFTDRVIEILSLEKEHIVFVLWGNFARSKRKLINNQKHLIVESAHPSPLSASRGFFGSKPFSKINDYLNQNNLKPIEW